jgi:hypothetical protein
MIVHMYVHIHNIYMFISIYTYMHLYIFKYLFKGTVSFGAYKRQPNAAHI